ncbi:hypothetical protein FRC02_005475 [Tulasnella sp. 418]|nr:hypothetical protein FRC02_005475 [Tulasnella sp. 418]
MRICTGHLQLHRLNTKSSLSTFALHSHHQPTLPTSTVIIPFFLPPPNTHQVSSPPPYRSYLMSVSHLCGPAESSPTFVSVDNLALSPH